MGNATIEITYSAKRGLREILVNDDELDISAIQGKPMADWFTASGDSWKGLLPEIHALLGDNSAKLDFEFFGTKEDKQRFFQCLEESRKKASEATEKDPKKLFRKAERAMAAEDEDEAFRCYLAAAELGHLEAMRCVAECFWKGNGTPQDQDKAIEWLQNAEDAGDDDAMKLMRVWRKEALCQGYRRYL